MNKNLIQGRCDGVSWHNTAKPVGEVVEVNQAAVRGRSVFLPGAAVEAGAVTHGAVRCRAWLGLEVGCNRISNGGRQILLLG